MAQLSEPIDEKISESPGKPANLLEIIFSPTGGTQRVADALADGCGLPVTKVDLTDRDFPELEAAPQDLALIAVPCFGGLIPPFAAERLGRIHGNGAMCIIVCVYGNRAYDDALVELGDLVAARGFRVIAAVAAVAEHSILRQFATGRPDVEDTARLKDFARQIMAKASNQDCSDIVAGLPGKRPYQKAASAPLYPRASRACNKCGICASNCPTGAIDPQNPRNTEKTRCIICMRCVASCPQSARKISPLMRWLASRMLKKACSVRKEAELYM